MAFVNIYVKDEGFMRNSDKILSQWIGDTLRSMNTQLLNYQSTCCCIDILGDKGKASGRCFSVDPDCSSCISRYLNKTTWERDESMFMWHYKMIPFLPKNLLESQWNRCIGIAEDIGHIGEPRGEFVKPVVQYPIQQFRDYCNMLIVAMVHNHINVSGSQISKLDDCIGFEVETINLHRDIFKDWHNPEYLDICLLNLKSLAFQGVIPESDYQYIKANVADAEVNK